MERHAHAVTNQPVTAGTVRVVLMTSLVSVPTTAHPMRARKARIPVAPQTSMRMSRTEGRSARAPTSATAPVPTTWRSGETMVIDSGERLHVTRVPISRTRVAMAAAKLAPIRALRSGLGPRGPAVPCVRERGEEPASDCPSPFSSPSSRGSPLFTPSVSGAAVPVAMGNGSRAARAWRCSFRSAQQQAEQHEQGDDHLEASDEPDADERLPAPHAPELDQRQHGGPQRQ